MSEIGKLNAQIYASLCSKESDTFKIQGPKVLIADAMALALLTQIITQEQLSFDEYILTYQISKCSKIKQLVHCTGVVFCAPTLENAKFIAALIEQKQAPLAKVVINFSSPPSDAVIDEVAKSDVNSLIECLKVTPAAYVPMLPNFCIGGVDGVYSFLLNYGALPLAIKYMKGSQQAAQVASQLQKMVSQNESLFPLSSLGKAKGKAKIPIQVVVIDANDDKLQQLMLNNTSCNLFQEYLRYDEAGKVYAKSQTFSLCYYNMQVADYLMLTYSDLRKVCAARQAEVNLKPPQTTDPLEMSKLLEKQEQFKQITNELTALLSTNYDIKEVEVFYDAGQRIQQRVFAANKEKLQKFPIESELNGLMSPLKQTVSSTLVKRERICALYCVLALSLQLFFQNYSVDKSRSVLTFLEFLKTTFCPEQTAQVDRYIAVIQNKKLVKDPYLGDIFKQSLISAQTIVTQKLFQNSKRTGVSQCAAQIDKELFSHVPLVYQIFEMGLTQNLNDAQFPLAEGSTRPPTIQDQPITLILKINGGNLGEGASLQNYGFYADQQDVSRLVGERSILFVDRLVGIQQAAAQLIDKAEQIE